MARKLYKVICEWDVGQEGLVFTSKEEAKEWVDNNSYLDPKETGESREDLWDQALVDIEEVSVYGG